MLGKICISYFIITVSEETFFFSFIYFGPSFHCCPFVVVATDWVWPSLDHLTSIITFPNLGQAASENFRIAGAPALREAPLFSFCVAERSFGLASRMCSRPISWFLWVCVWDILFIYYSYIKHIKITFTRNRHWQHMYNTTYNTWKRLECSLVLSLFLRQYRKILFTYYFI